MVFLYFSSCNFFLFFFSFGSCCVGGSVRCCCEHYTRDPFGAAAWWQRSYPKQVLDSSLN